MCVCVDVLEDLKRGRVKRTAVVHRLSLLKEFRNDGGQEDSSSGGAATFQLTVGTTYAI